MPFVKNWTLNTVVERPLLGLKVHRIQPTYFPNAIRDTFKLPFPKSEGIFEQKMKKK